MSCPFHCHAPRAIRLVVKEGFKWDCTLKQALPKGCVVKLASEFGCAIALVDDPDGYLLDKRHHSRYDELDKWFHDELELNEQFCEQESSGFDSYP